jgi:hypothetical protein
MKPTDAEAHNIHPGPNRAGPGSRSTPCGVGGMGRDLLRRLHLRLLTAGPCRGHIRRALMQHLLRTRQSRAQQNRAPERSVSGVLKLECRSRSACRPTRFGASARAALPPHARARNRYSNSAQPRRGGLSHPAGRDSRPGQRADRGRSFSWKPWRAASTAWVLGALSGLAPRRAAARPWASPRARLGHPFGVAKASASAVSSENLTRLFRS